MKRTVAIALVALASLAANVLVSADQTPAAPQAPAPAAPPAAAGPGRGGGGPVVSPEVLTDGRVTFRLRAPGATSVGVNLSGRQGQGPIAMQKDAQGLWSVTTDAMAPDIYTYSLAVDGGTINDPTNRQVQTSFGSFQSMVVVPGPAAVAAGAGRAARRHHAAHLPLDRRERRPRTSSSTRPPGYDARRAQPYPVLYLLHGLGDDAERWMTGGGGAHNIFDNLIAAKSAVADGRGHAARLRHVDGPGRRARRREHHRLHDILLNELMPIVDKAYNVSKQPRGARDRGPLDGRRRNRSTSASTTSTVSRGSARSAPRRSLWPALSRTRRLAGTGTGRARRAWCAVVEAPRRSRRSIRLSSPRRSRR